jgi:uncharacterized membrane protein YidH (DUF202 family)
MTYIKLKKRGFMMRYDSKQRKIQKIADIKDHLSNERTYLAWVRTSIGIMAFGFVVEKFSLFLKQIAYLLGATSTTPSTNLQGYSSLFGVALVAFGAIICLLAFINYRKVKKQIENDNYKPSFLLDWLLTLAILIMGIFLVIYLVVV